MTHTPFHYLGLLITILLAIALLIRLFAPKGWYLRGGVAFLIGPGLKNAIQKLLEELPGKVQKETIAEVATHVIWRLTRVGVFAIIVAFIPFILLWQQNRLLQQQNERIDQQTFLIEGQRRSSLILMMSNIMDKVDEEIKVQKEQMRRHLYKVKKIESINDPLVQLDSIQEIEETIDTIKFRLSNSLIGRITALSLAFKEYQYLDGDSLTTPLSPERGQLLLAIVQSNLNSTTLSKIYDAGTFNGADLGHIDLGSRNMRGIALWDANLKGAFLDNTDLREAILDNSFLEESIFWKADLTEAKLTGANLTWADFTNANLYKAYVDFAVMKGTDFTDANLSNATFRFSDLSTALFSGADLSGADLSGANLTGANLGNANLRGANLSNCDLEGVHFISLDQVLSTLSLYKTKNIPDSLLQQILHQKPRLLEKPDWLAE